jgi:hypothetical protein
VDVVCDGWPCDEAEPRSGTWGSGAFGLAFSITTTAAYLPAAPRQVTDQGILIGPRARRGRAVRPVRVAGDRPLERLVPDAARGAGRPFMLAALGPLGFCLLLMPFIAEPLDDRA